jgi:hypothetical protein
LTGERDAFLEVSRGDAPAIMGCGVVEELMSGSGQPTAAVSTAATVTACAADGTRDAHWWANDAYADPLMDTEALLDDDAHKLLEDDLDM